MTDIDTTLLHAIGEARANTTRHLLTQLQPEGCWRGELSASPLATSVTALAWHHADPDAYAPRIARALDWLRATQHADGAWGDTPTCRPNLSTTLLAWSTLSACDRPEDEDARRRAADWITRRLGNTQPETLARGILHAYGEDRTFSVPILTHCALAGTLGDDPWRHVPALPFELAALPHACFRWLRLPVVSYALPALIAIGLVRHTLTQGCCSPRRWLRSRVKDIVLRKLNAIQPENGGFLEAAPLTAFVVLSLCGSGLKDHPVTARGLRFLCGSQREDGSLPIDTDLATWLTTHAIRALPPEALTDEQDTRVRGWLLGCQHTTRHPYTHAAGGGWAWTDRPGGVPDADDTSGALLALRRWEGTDADIIPPVRAGVAWLLGLQNRDGGMPAFCRGWGTMPFDRSCPDITAHALLAFSRWQGHPASSHLPLAHAISRGVSFLKDTQTGAGAWHPLWFGNLDAEGHRNPVFGTAQVCFALAGVDTPDVEGIRTRGLAFLTSQQNLDGGWGGARAVPSSVEETALALAALAMNGVHAPLVKGMRWLLRTTRGGTVFPTAPIGLYFSSLWYAEALYPVLFSLQAFRMAEACLSHACAAPMPDSNAPRAPERSSGIHAERNVADAAAHAACPSARVPEDHPPRPVNMDDARMPQTPSAPIESQSGTTGIFKYALAFLVLLAIGILLRQEFAPPTPNGSPLPHGIIHPPSGMGSTRMTGANLDARPDGSAGDSTMQDAPPWLDGAWSMFRGDPALSGSTDAPLAASLRLRWTTPLGASIQASPIVAGRKVYNGTESGAFVALHLHDGTEAWRTELDAGVEAAALHHNGILHIGTTAGTVYALDPADGRVRWTFAAGGMVTGAANVKLDPDTGHPVLYVGSHDKHLYALAAETGALRWRYRAGSYLNGTPALAGDALILAGCDHAVRILDPQTGKERMTVEVGSYVPGSPAVAGGVAYVGHFGNEVVAVNLDDGSIAWRTGDPEAGHPFFASPAVAGDHVLVGNRGGVLRNLRASDGGVRWEVRLGGALDAAPVIAGEKVVVGGMDGRLQLLRLDDGTRLFRYDVGAPIPGTPAVLPGAVVVAARDGRVLLFEDAR